MITQAQTFGSDKFVVARAPISHPMADEVSIALGDNGYCRFPYSVELAFFMGGKWVTDILPEFAEYADAPAMDTRIYAWVPLEIFARFMDTYCVRMEA